MDINTPISCKNAEVLSLSSRECDEAHMEHVYDTVLDIAEDIKTNSQSISEVENNGVEMNTNEAYGKVVIKTI